MIEAGKFFRRKEFGSKLLACEERPNPCGSDRHWTFWEMNRGCLITLALSVVEPWTDPVPLVTWYRVKAWRVKGHNGRWSAGNDWYPTEENAKAMGDHIEIYGIEMMVLPE